MKGVITCQKIKKVIKKKIQEYSYDENLVERVSHKPKNLICGNFKVRYVLEIELTQTEDKGSVSVIMMNPSKAVGGVKKESDKSVDAVIKGIKKLKDKNKISGIKYINVLNLLPFYSTLPGCLNDLLQNYSPEESKNIKKICDKNLNFIKSYTKISKYTFLAWGDSADFNQRILEQQKIYTLDYLQSKGNVYVFYNKKGKVLSHKNNPYHPSRRSVKDIKKICIMPTLKIEEIK